MQEKFKGAFIWLIVVVSAARGLSLLKDMGRWHQGHDRRLIVLGEEQGLLRLVVGRPKVAALVTDLDGQDEQAHVFAAQNAITPVPIWILNGRNDREIPNYLRGGAAVILDSLTLARRTEILARVEAEGLAVDQFWAGQSYLVLRLRPDR